MADIRGFRGVRYDLDSLEADAEDVVAPPYDVIDTDQQQSYYEQHPHNVIRLVLNREHDQDNEENNRYTRARRHLMDWLAEGALTLDDTPGLYAHYQDFDDPRGERYTRRGMLGLVGLEPYDQEVVLPHEKTLRGPKVDRLKLMKACEANMSPVFLLYDDPERKIDELLADHRASRVLDATTERDGIRHRLWPVFDEDVRHRVQEFFEDEQLLIADGHHRYETALAYRNFRREVDESPRETAPWEYVMAFMVNMHDPGLQIFPTHRLVHDVEAFDPDELTRALRDSSHFELRDLDETLQSDIDGTIEQLERAGDDAPSFVFDGHAWERPKLVQFTGTVDSPVFDNETHEDVRQLDTAILHEAILDRMLGIDKEAQEAKRNLEYTRDLDEAVDATSDDDYQMVVFMNPTEIGEVIDVCRSGGKMPQKSTYFYPKVLSGLAINLL
jgi:uncharacterized protein (DUF1015 family)